MSTNNFLRFTGRAADYDKYRPTYPTALFEHLHRTVRLAPGEGVADVAAGTGIFTEHLARWGNPVYVVEPNEQMMAMAKNRLADKSNCFFSDGVAEATGLTEQSAKLILVAQAFHWFDPQKTKTEFLRIGTVDAYTGIVWNKRRTDLPFGKGYEAILRTYGKDYLQVSHSSIGRQEIDSFFAPETPELHVFPHTDFITYETVRGRLASYSFMPEPSSATFRDVEKALRKLFDRHQISGVVSLSYETRLYLGQLRPQS